MRYVVMELRFLDSVDILVTYYSTANDEPLHQRIRKVGGPHALLHHGNIIWYSPEFDDLVFQIGNRKTRPRIAITRLPNRTGI